MSTYPPACQVWVDGKRMADGCKDGEMPADPVVLTDLTVTWGRSNTLDQCDPSTASFTVMDEGGDPRFTSVLHQGSQVIIKAEATIWTDPDEFGGSALLYDPGFEDNTTVGTPLVGGVTQVNSEVRSTSAEAETGSRSARVTPQVGTKGPVRAIFPPGPYGGNTAWDSVPQTAPGQLWRIGASVLTRAYYGASYKVTVRPAYFKSPTSTDYTLGNIIGTTYASGTWTPIVAEIAPTAYRWLGVCVEITPLNVPRWSDIPASTTWESLGGAATVRTNQANDPRGTTGRWRSIGAGVGGALTSTYVTGADDGPIPELTSYYRKTWTTGTTGSTPSAATGSAVYADGGSGLFPVVAGKTYTLSCWMRHNSARAKQYQILAYLYNASGVLLRFPVVTAPSFPANTWVRNSVTFTVQPGEVAIRNTLSMTSGANWQEWAAGESLDATGMLLEEAPSMGTYFDGSTADTTTVENVWTGTPGLSTSTQTTYAETRPAWRDMGSVWVDNLLVQPPTEGGIRRGNVFAGRVTDMTARYDMDLGATVVDVIAQSTLAELDNRYTGTNPWPAEKLSLRFDRILDYAGQPNMTWQVDSTVGNVKVSYREAGLEPAASLLQELAQSVGGALWSAHSDLTGSYLWLEDIDRRPATRILVLDPDNVVRIHPADIVADGESFIQLSACDLLLEPVEWIQTTEDDATQVGFTWLQQTVEDGVPKPVAQTFEVTDYGQESITGRRRLTVSTVLSDYAEALSTANTLLARASTPGWRVNGLTLAVAAFEQLDNDAVQTMMAILDGVTRLGLGIILTDIPDWAPVPEGQDIALFLEGGRFRNRDGAWELELLTSSAVSQGKATVRWQDLPGNTVTVRTNIAVNPRAISTGADGWLATRGFNTNGAGTYSYATGVAGPANGLTTARRKQWTQSATAPNNGNSGFEVLETSSSYFPVVAGKTYTISVWMRHTATTTKTVLLRANFWDALAGGTQVGSTVTGTSTAVAPTAGATRANRVLNPMDRTGGAAGWLTTRTFGTGGAGTHTHSQAMASPVGNPVTWTGCRKTWTTAATNSDLTGFNTAADATNWYAVTAGETITVSAFMRHNSATTKDFAIAVVFYDGVAQATAVTVGTATYGSSVTKAGDGTWARVSLTVTVPAGAAGMRIIPDVRGSTATPWNINSWLDATGVMIESGSVLGTYFDGSSTTDASTNYVWLGTAWASASAMNLLTTAWTRLSLTVSPPVGAVGMKVYPDTATAGDAPWQIGETLTATGLLIEEAGSAGNWFDGTSPDSTAGTVTVDNEWTGTVNASTSTQTTTDTSTAWSWDEFDPAISWNDLQGVGMP